MGFDRWAEARRQMLLDPSVTNLNTGSFGPLSRVVFEEATELRRQLAWEPMDFLVRKLPPLLWNSRRRLAEFLGRRAERLLFTVNVTASVNLVASSLQLVAPGEILMTDHEYGAMHWTWERTAQRMGLSLRTFPLPTMPRSVDEVVAAATKAMTPATRLFFFSHVLSPTGLVLPAKELCAEARRRGIITMIDGAHAPAMIPLNVEDVGADFYGGNCHKWLLAPTGSGFLYIGSGNEDRLQPLQVSWGWYGGTCGQDEQDEFGSTPRLRKLEFEGTRDPCAWLAVPKAIDFQAGLGREAIRERFLGLAAYVRRTVGAVPGLKLATPEAFSGTMTAFELPAGKSPQALRDAMWRHRIEVPIIERPDRLLVRASTHFYNTKEEVDGLAGALREVLM